MKAVARDHLPQEEWEVAQAAALRKRILVVNVIVYKDRKLRVAIFFSNSMAFLAVVGALVGLLASRALVYIEEEGCGAKRTRRIFAATMLPAALAGAFSCENEARG